MPKQKDDYGTGAFSRFKSDSYAPYLRLDVDVPWQDIYREALPFKDQCPSKDYVFHGESTSQGWSAGCLHGHAFEQVQSRGSYPKALRGLDTGYRWIKAVQDQCPVTVNYFKHIFTPHTQYRRLRWMWLEPGGFVKPHVDDDERILAINLAIYNPKGCEFVFGKDQVLPFENGTAFVIDAGQQHHVVNDSDEARLHIQVHGKDITEWYDNIIEHSLNQYKGTRWIGKDEKYEYERDWMNPKKLFKQMVEDYNR